VKAIVSFIIEIFPQKHHIVYFPFSLETPMDISSPMIFAYSYRC